ncbi:carbon-nitrogen hydrolase family protein [Chloroflexi bacterium TSY]|nr:carbon-nitrogen hydrolase family protein [Chloroflexi bacterium TSY]
MSGYAPAHFETLANYAWDVLSNHTQDICQLALSYRLWVVLGSMRMIEGDQLPRSCLHVISDEGEIVGTYDKQRLYQKEKQMFRAGNKPCVIEINGFKCGFLICYDNCFPELYDEYRDLGVGLLFHSFYNAANRRSTSIKDLMLANLIVRAADNQMWISASNSSKRYSPLSACIVRPDGTTVHARRNVTGLVIDSYPDHVLGWTYNNRIL